MAVLERAVDQAISLLAQNGRPYSPTAIIGPSIASRATADEDEHYVYAIAL
jgi:hypothetical protein